MGSYQCNVFIQYQEGQFCVECSSYDKLVNVCNSFAEKINVELKELNFEYKNNSLDLTKSFNEIATPEDLQKRAIIINAYRNEAYNNEINNEVNTTQCDLNARRDSSNKSQNQSDESCCKKYRCRIFGFIIGFIVLGVIVFLILYFTLIKDKKDKKCEEGEGEKCAKCDNILNTCLQCNVGYELFDNSCNLYSILATYNNNNSTENINIINPDSIKNIYFMKINDINQNPTSQFSFTNSEDRKVYLFFKKKSKISLSYMFNNIQNLNEISFNEPINSYEIKNIEGMFSGCRSLEKVDLKNFEGEKIKSTSNLFLNCISLTSVDISNLNTKSITNMASMFNNCNKLSYLNLRNFNTENVEDM